MKLEQVLATDLLEARTPNVLSIVERRFQTTRAATARLAQLEQCCEWVRLVCRAHTVGVSLFTHPEYDELTWVTVVGMGAEFQGRRYPLRHSMCGVCFDRGVTQLFIEAQQYFQWLQQHGIRVAEGLVFPLKNSDEIYYGTIWVVAHEGQPNFGKAELTILQQISVELYWLISQSTGGIVSSVHMKDSARRSFKVERRVPFT